jgi:hypothetical protein
VNPDRGELLVRLASILKRLTMPEVVELSSLLEAYERRHLPRKETPDEIASKPW